MNNEYGNKIVGGIILIGFLFILFCLIGAFNAFEDTDYFGAGIFMLAASLPITAAIHGILKKK